MIEKILVKDQLASLPWDSGQIAYSVSVRQSEII